MDVDRRRRTEDALIDAMCSAAEAGAEVALDGFRTDLHVETKSGRFDRVTEIDRAVQRRVRESLAGAVGVFPGDAVEGTDEGVAGDVPFVGEEEDARKTVPERGPAWVVDPIDGTNNFVGGGVIWAVAIAATDDVDPLAAVTHLPAVGDTYVADTADRDADAGRGEAPASPAGSAARRNGTPIRVSQRADPASFTINPIFGFSDRHRRQHRAVVETIFDEFGDLRRIGSAQAALASVASGEIDAAVSTVELQPWDTVGGVRLVRAAGGVVTDVHGDRWRSGAEGLIASNGRAHEALVEALGGR